MLVGTLLDLIPKNGKLKVVLSRHEKGARIALIPKPDNMADGDGGTELDIRQAALVSPIVIDFDPQQPDLESALTESISAFSPGVANAASQLENYRLEQQRLAAEAAEAAKKKASTAKAKKVAKTATKKASQPTGDEQPKEKKEDANGDLFAAGIAASGAASGTDDGQVKPEAAPTTTPPPESQASEPSDEGGQVTGEVAS